jgi:hypothetical protein
MTAKEKLIRFLEKKNEIVKEMTGLSYITKEDIEDIKNWKDKNSEKAWETIVLNMEMSSFRTSKNKIVLPNDCFLCPWCIIYDDEDCNNCGYKKRHGDCESANSLYKKICNTKNPANSNEWAYGSVGAILENSPKYEELLEILRKKND